MKSKWASVSAVPGAEASFAMRGVKEVMEVTLLVRR